MGVVLDSSDQPGGADTARLLAGYAPLPGIFDEMMDADGRVRPHWNLFLAKLAALGPEEMSRRFAAADRHLRDSGVFYRIYEDPAGGERPWPFSHVPLILDGAEFRQLKEGLVQRAEMLEMVLQDIYGPARLVREGRLPAALVAGNPEFLRPLSGVAPGGDAFLSFYAVDVGRGVDGRWWVLGDRTQAPSGAGFALENRVALSRVLPDAYRELHVERLAGFFQTFEQALSGECRPDSRVCLLTPGPMNETYFEHAYLARHLGFLLVEGEDLTVRDDGVFIRTVSGLRRADVLVRRLDADFADPLELNARSRLGVPGLVQAVRDGAVMIVNELGSGFVEARALMSYLPALAPVLAGGELAIPNIATWWLGQTAVREHVMKRFDEMVIASAFFDPLPGHNDAREVIGGALSPMQRARIFEAIAHRGVDFVAQEAVTLSTMPIVQDGKFAPRPFILRLYLAWQGYSEGWTVMPGGFVRIADDVDARAVSLQHGGRTADVWVPSDTPVHDTALLTRAETIVVNRTTGALPSRAANNLFWVARYVERAEATLRLVRALLNRIMEADDGAAPLIARLTSLLGAWSAIPKNVPNARPTLTALAVMQRRDLDGALPHHVGAARAAASVIRDRFSPDAWRALVDLSDLIAAPLPAGSSDIALTERVNGALRIIASFSGLAQENMSRLAGWRFLELGRRIERAVATCRFLRQFALDTIADGALDALLELADSLITYRLRYDMLAAPTPVIDLVMLDPANPRSVAFQIECIETHLAALPRRAANGRLSLPQQIATLASGTLRTTQAARIDEPLIVATEGSLMRLSEAIATAYFTHYERPDDAWEAFA
jgi:uncharacterized circularly permuted ATP-grasp superfamily protein/uncharacterized alpha-E superfamily protein